MNMPIKVKTVGALIESLPQGSDELNIDGMTVSEALGELVSRHGEGMASDLYQDGKIRRGLAFLLNGRNVLGLPQQFATRLKDGDELIIATLLAGG